LPLRTPKAHPEKPPAVTQSNRNASIIHQNRRCDFCSKRLKFAQTLIRQGFKHVLH
jgi:hypothetical protein